MCIQVQVVRIHLSSACRTLRFRQPTASSMQKPLQHLPFVLQLDMQWLPIRPCPHRPLSVLVHSNSNSSNNCTPLTHLCKAVPIPTRRTQPRRHRMGIAALLRLRYLLRCQSSVRVRASLIRPSLCQKCQKFMTGRHHTGTASAWMRSIAESKRRQVGCNRRL